jgi:hypothetical protein
MVRKDSMYRVDVLLALMSSQYTGNPADARTVRRRCCKRREMESCTDATPTTLMYHTVRKNATTNTVRLRYTDVV